MALSKLEKFAALSTFPYVFEYTSDDARTRLQERLADFDRVVLELACGNGEYTVALAEQYPNTAFVGVDIQGERLWQGASQAAEKNIPNAFFLRAYIERITTFFVTHSIDEIWITFPDPFPKDRHAKRRLTHARFLDMYEKILTPGGDIHLKTDDTELYYFSQKQIKQHNSFSITKTIDNIDTAENIPEVLLIETKFEKKWRRQGKIIRYVVAGSNEQ